MSAPDGIDDLAMLAEFAQLAMERARIAIRRAEAVEAEGGDPMPQLAIFDRMGRAMRLALALRRRFIGEAEQLTSRRVQTRKDRLKAALTPAIRLHAPYGERQALDWALAHRLETEADAFASLPFEAGVAHLVRILGLPQAAQAAESFKACPDVLAAPVLKHPPPGRSPIEGEVDRDAGRGTEGGKERGFAEGQIAATNARSDLSGRRQSPAATAPLAGKHLVDATLRPAPG
jgi:hypothetical protein